MALGILGGIMRHNLSFLTIVLVFVATAAWQTRAFPPMEGSDEPLHVAYVMALRETGQLPERATYRTNCTRQESGQPPLTYVAGAVVLNIMRVPRIACDDVYDYYYRTINNQWLGGVDPQRPDDNKRVFLQTVPQADILPAPPPTGLAALRLVSTFFGAMAVVGAYGAASEVFTRRRWRVLTVIVFAFMPTFLHVSSYFNNDSSATAFTTLTLWVTLRALRLGFSVRRGVVIGVIAGLGGLAKVSVLLVGAGVGTALLLDWSRRNYPFRQVFIYGLATGLPVLVLFGAWVAYGLITFGDPIGTGTHVLPALNYDPPLDWWTTLRGTPGVYLSYIGRLGNANVFMHPITYATLSVVVGLGLIGGVFRPRIDWRQALVLLATFVAVYAGFIGFYRVIFAVTGRLLLPVHVVFAVTVVGGLATLARYLPRSLELYLSAIAGTVFAVAGLVSTPLNIQRAYFPVTQPAAPTKLAGPVFDYDETIRFLGYETPGIWVDDNQHFVRLCWEVLAEPTRGAAFSLKFVRDGAIVADRTSVLGLGNYNAEVWTPGEVICDDVEVPVADDAARATVYDMLLVLLDPQTQAVDWHATHIDGAPVEFPVIGQVAVPAGDMRADLTPVDVTFADFAQLTGYSLDFDVDGESSLTLGWEVIGRTPDDWAQFVQLVGPNGFAAVADGTPRNGAYPTWAWRAGETIVDTWTFDLDDLPSGEYALNVGFYRRDTGDRMPASVDGQPAPDKAPTLQTVTVP